MSRKVVLEIYTCSRGYGLTLSRDEGKVGEGYRVFGPKLNGMQVVARTESLDVADIDRLIAELKLSKKFLKDSPQR